MVGWCSLFLQTVAKDVPLEVLPEDPEDRASNDWWKSKKWSYGNLNRLFVRYAHSVDRPRWLRCSRLG